MSNGIFGLQPWAVFFMFIILLMGLYIYSRITTLQRLQKKVDNRIVFEFWNPANGTVKEYLCDLVGESEIKVPDKLIKKYNAEKDNLQGIQLPEQIGGGVYFTTPDALFDDWYPKGKKIQVKVKKAAFYGSIPLPIIALNCDLWTSEMLATQASSIIKKSRDDFTLQVLQAQDNTWANNLDKLVMVVKKIPTLQWIGIGAVGAAGLAAYFAYQAVDLLKIWAGG